MSDFANSNELFQYRNRLQQCRVSQLMAACRYYGIKKAGSKQELVERLVEFLTSASRNDRFNLSNALESDTSSGIRSPRTPRSPGTLGRGRSSFANADEKLGDSSKMQMQEKPDELSREQKISYASIDPFHPLANVENPFLFFRTCHKGSIDFPLHIPEMKALRRQGFSVWLRGMYKLSPKAERQKWPNELRVCVNNVRVGTVEPPKRLKKRRDEPIDLTRFLQSGTNNINLCVIDDTPSNFSVAIVVCASLSDQTIMGLVPPQSEESARERMVSILSVKSELIADENEGYRSLDLRCPVGLSRIRIPVRGVKCNHIRCFDLASYVSVNRSTSNLNLRWLCPICNTYVPPKDLLIDSYVLSILKITAPQVSEVLVSEKDASWILNPRASLDDISSHEEENSGGSPKRLRAESADSDVTLPEDPDYMYPPEPIRAVVELSDTDSPTNNRHVLKVQKPNRPESAECEIIDLD